MDLIWLSLKDKYFSFSKSEKVSLVMQLISFSCNNLERGKERRIIVCFGIAALRRQQAYVLEGRSTKLGFCLHFFVLFCKFLNLQRGQIPQSCQHFGSNQLEPIASEQQIVEHGRRFERSIFNLSDLIVAKIQFQQVGQTLEIIGQVGNLFDSIVVQSSVGNKGNKNRLVQINRIV